MSITLVTVVTNPAQYEQLIARNPHTANCQLRSYNNSQENLPIPTRYNHFIENELPAEGWVIFCHQDFEFLQDPADILEGLDTNYIYGPIGVSQTKHRSWQLTIHTYRFWPSLKRKTEIRSHYLGQITEHPAGKPPHLAGQKITTAQEVDTLDCCCVIVHTSLLRQKSLKFDPIFDFHLYVEDLCLAAKHKEILSKAIQIDCCHHSSGSINPAFWEKYTLLLNKYPKDVFLTTCASDPQKLLRFLVGNRSQALLS